eukprot:jgi/Chrzof1/11010/Cz05g20090.t1
MAALTTSYQPVWHYRPFTAVQHKISPRSIRCTRLAAVRAACIQHTKHHPAPSAQTNTSMIRRALATAAAAVLLTASPSYPTYAAEVQPMASQPQQQQLQQQQQQPPSKALCPQADLSALFGFGKDADDPIEPFTLYGTTFKKFSIEQLDGDKVLSRHRGFTVDTCVGAIEAAQETPEFQSLSTGEKVRAAGNLLCKESIGPDLKPACVASCSSACDAALKNYADMNEAETGYQIQPADKTRVLKNCRRSCVYECTKSGKARDFVVPYNR